MKKILQWLHRKIDGKSICLIFTALFFLTVSLFTALIISLYSEYTKAQIAAFLQEKNTQQLRRMSFSIEEDVDDTIALANTAYYQIIKSTDLQALLTEQTLSDFCQLHENKILYAAFMILTGHCSGRMQRIMMQNLRTVLHGFRQQKPKLIPLHLMCLIISRQQQDFKKP